MNFEYVEMPSTRKCLGRKFSVVIPVNANAPDFARRNFMGHIHFYLSSLAQSLPASESIDEATRAVERYLVGVEKAVVWADWGANMVKIGKGASAVSVRAKLECWVGESLANGQRKQVSSSFYAPSSSVMACPEKGYGMLSEWFVIKKLAEVAERAFYKKQMYKRVPVAPSVCPPHVLREVRKRMMTQLTDLGV